MEVFVLFSAQIAAQTSDIFTIWKIVPIYNIYPTTRHIQSISYFIFISDICHNLGKFVRTNKNCLRLCLKTDMDLNHCTMTPICVQKTTKNRLQIMSLAAQASETNKQTSFACQATINVTLLQQLTSPKFISKQSHDCVLSMQENSGPKKLKHTNFIWVVTQAGTMHASPFSCLRFISSRSNLTSHYK